MTDNELVAYLENQGYSNVRKVPTGEWIGTCKLIFTCGLFIGLDEFGYSRRYCYHSCAEAEIASKYWSGVGDPLGNWIVEKPGNRQGPGSPYYVNEEKDVA